MAEETEGDEKVDSPKKEQKIEEKLPEKEQPKRKDEEEQDSEDLKKGIIAVEIPVKEEEIDEKPLQEELVELKEVKEYDMEELKGEIEGTEIPEEEKSSEILLTAIQEERKRLEEERAKLHKEMEQKEKIMKEKDEEEEAPTKPKTIKSFAKERRKRKELERLKSYLFIGEYAMLVVLILALLYAEGTSFKPFRLPLESTIYLIIVFFLVLKVEKFYFRFMNIKYSGTLQRKAIGVEHFKAIEIPPMMLIAFVVAMLLIPPTSGIINIVLDMITFEREYIPLSSGFTFNLAMLFLAGLILSMGWLIFLLRYRDTVIAPEMEKVAEPFVIEDVFLITNSGLLISHAGKELKPDIDDDILSSMLTAVKEFVKDSFGTSTDEGELDELQYGKVRVIIEYGKHVYLAAVVRGQESMDLRPEMKRMLKQADRKYGHIWDSWDGDLSQLKGIQSMTRSLVNMR